MKSTPVNRGTTDYELIVHAGRGPVEVRRFVKLLAEHLVKRARNTRQAVTAPSLSGTEPCVVLRLRGDACSLDDELGTHLLIDATRGAGQRKRWFASVHRLQMTHGADFDAADVKVETCRAGGPGGQHVNRTASAVRAVHVPTGVAVRVQSQRSQHRNRAEALRLLEEKVRSAASAASEQLKRRAMLSAFEIERGRPVRTYRIRRGQLVPEAKG